MLMFRSSFVGLLSSRALSTMLKFEGVPTESGGEFASVVTARSLGARGALSEAVADRTDADVEIGVR
jgi:hypothetical protein